jgi:hypothetical protein
MFFSINAAIHVAVFVNICGEKAFVLSHKKTRMAGFIWDACTAVI